MNIKKKKKNIELLILLFIIAIILGAYNSYASYFSQVLGGAEAEVAKWAVTVNTEDIIEKNNLTGNIGIKVLPNTNVAAGKMAPGSVGYMDVVIDTSEAEVACKYTITFPEESVINQKGFDVYGYQVFDTDSEQNVEIVSSPKNTQYTEITNDKIEGNIELEETTQKGKSIVVRIFVSWADWNTDSEAQTNIGLSMNELNSRVNVLVEQMD